MGNNAENIAENCKWSRWEFGKVDFVWGFIKVIAPCFPVGDIGMDFLNIQNVLNLYYVQAYDNPFKFS